MASVCRGGKDVTLSMHRYQQRGVSCIVVQLSAQAADQDIDAAMPAFFHVAAECRLQTLAAEHFPGVLYQCGQQLIFAAGKTMPRSILRKQRAAVQVELPGTETDNRRVVAHHHGTAPAAQQGFDAREQFARIERLADIIVSADLKTDDAIDVIVLLADEDDADVRARTQFARHRQTILSRQENIHDHDVHRRRRQQDIELYGALTLSDARSATAKLQVIGKTVSPPLVHCPFHMRIALLNFNREDADLMSASLGANGHACLPLANTRDVSDLHEGCAMLILDLASPVAIALLRAARGQWPELPLMFVADRNDDALIVDALNAGADDYFVKPMRRGELATRVQVLLKRKYPEQQEEQIRFGCFSFEPHAHRITRDEETIPVTQKEFELALLFFRHLDRPLSRAYIKESIWSRELELPSRTLDTHVSRVRSKLGLRPENGFRLAPVYSYGYRLEQLPP